MKKSLLGPIRVGRKILCKSCKTKTYTKIIGRKINVNYGIIVRHKKDCNYMERVIKNSVEV